MLSRIASRRVVQALPRAINRGITMVLNPALYVSFRSAPLSRVRVVEFPSISQSRSFLRCFSLSGNGSFSVQDEIDTCTSFDAAVDLIPGYETRSFGDNIRVLATCGHYAFGKIYSRQHPLFSVVNEFVHYLDSVCSQCSDVNTLPQETLINGLWAVARFGYTLQDQSVVKLLQCLLDSSFSRISQFTTSELGIFLKSLGKLAYSPEDSKYQHLIDCLYDNRDAFSLAEYVNILWGISRMGKESKDTWTSGNPKVVELFSFTENLLALNPEAIKVLKPSYYVNLVYSYSYLHHPHTQHILSEMINPLCSFIHRMTPLEVVLVYRAYVESRVVSPELERRVCNFIRIRYNELNASTALGLLFSYSRSLEFSHRSVQSDVIAILTGEVHRCLQQFSTRDLLYLVCSFNHLRLYPKEDIDVIAEKLVDHVDTFSPRESFYVLTCLNRSRYTSPTILSLFSALTEKYCHSEESSLFITGVRCMLLRFAANRHLSKDEVLGSLLSDFSSHPDCFDARSICQILINTNFDQSLSKDDLMRLLKRFTVLCSQQGKVNEKDLLNTVTSLVPYTKKYKSLVIPITMSMGVTAWIGCQGNKLSPSAMSDLMLFLGKMGTKSVPLIELFEKRYAKKMGDFSDEDLVKLLKSFALVGYQNEQAFHYIVDQLSLVVSTLTTQNALSFLWAVTVLVPDHVELMTRICADIERRTLNDMERENFKNLQSVIAK